VFVSPDVFVSPEKCRARFRLEKMRAKNRFQAFAWREPEGNIQVAI